MTMVNEVQVLELVAKYVSLRSTDPTRHKCFISYHVKDVEEVLGFVQQFGEAFIPRSVGVTEEDDFVDSDDPDYIKRRIREKYLADSSVTILLLGKETWGRKFIDWEIASSLRNDPVNRRSGLLVIPLPSMNNTAKLPDRVKDNWIRDDPEQSYALYKSYPTSHETLRDNIHEAFTTRTSKGNLVNNSRPLRQRNN